MIDQLKTAAAVAIVFPYALIYGIVATIADLVKPKQRATNHGPTPASKIGRSTNSFTCSPRTPPNGTAILPT